MGSRADAQRARDGECSGGGGGSRIHFRLMLSVWYCVILSLLLLVLLVLQFPLDTELNAFRNWDRHSKSKIELSARKQSNGPHFLPSYLYGHVSTARSGIASFRNLRGVSHRESYCTHPRPLSRAVQVDEYHSVVSMISQP